MSKCRTCPVFGTPTVVRILDIYGDDSFYLAGTASTPSADGMASFQSLMASMVSRMSEQGLNSPPEERFRVQLETLTSMGFVDRQANIQGESLQQDTFEN